VKDSAPTPEAVPSPTAVAAVPTLTSVVPGSGPAAGNNNVVLNGTDFVGVIAVTFGTKAALGYSVDSATKITAVAPSGTGTVAVTVRTPTGTSNPVTYTYAAQPALTAAVPNQGPSSGGTSVVLTGTSLGSAGAVMFGSTPAASYVVNSATQITAVAPAGRGAVPITVTTPGGTTGPVVYTYVTPPVLASVTPAQGPTAAGAAVTLTGSGLTTTTAVRFGAAPAAFTVLSDTRLAATAPAGAAGPVQVSVTSIGGTSGSLTYTRVAPPAV
jgi:IPT/TIG domain-containing protein